MSHYFNDVGDSARNYDQMRRRRARWSMEGFGGPIEEVAGADVAARLETNSAARAIVIGVVTGALTLIVNRWLERLLK